MTTQQRSRKGLPMAVLASFALFALAGCTGGDDGEGDALQAALDAVESGDLVLYLNLTIDGQQYSYSTASATTPPALTPPPSPPPLSVNATLEAEGLPEGADADLSWSVDWGEHTSGRAPGNASGNATAPGASGNGSAGAGGNASAPPSSTGTSLPASLHHQYTTAGTHRIQAVLEMAGERVHGLQVPISVGGNDTSDVEPGTVLGNASFTEEGDFPMAPLGCGAAAEFPWTFNATVNGTKAEVTQIVLALDAQGTVQDTELQLIDSNGTVVAEGDGGADKELTADGPLPPGNYTVSVAGCMTLGASYALEGSATYVAAAASKP